MPIYDRPVRLLIRDMIEELAPQKGQIFSREHAIEWFRKHYGKIKEGTISAHLIRFSTNARSRLHYGPKYDWSPSDENLLFQVDGSHFRRYDPATDPVPFSPGHSPPPTIEDPDPAQTPSEFAYESDLRDFLAKNPSVIEPGLQLYEDDEGIKGVEFPAGNRRIDILAVDDRKRLVVIELKVSRGYDRTVGQLLVYMARIKKDFAEPDQDVRGIIAAREMSDDLRLACSNLPSVSLYEYELSVKLRKIPTSDLDA